MGTATTSAAPKPPSKRRAACTRVLLWGAFMAVTWACTYLVIDGSLKNSAADGPAFIVMTSAGDDLITEIGFGPAAARSAPPPAPRPLRAEQQRLAAAPSAAPEPGLKEVFATLWASELLLQFNLSNAGPLPPQHAQHSLEETLDTLKAQGVGILFTSFRWGEQEPAPSALDFRLQDYVQRAACSRGLRLAVVLDAQQTPPWVLERFPDAALVDARGGARQDVSFSHEGAMALAAAWGGAALERLAAVDAACIHSIQPSFNNEYETKYTQERDCFQDYSPGALAAFRRHLAARNPDLAFWNARWGGDAPLAYHPFRPFASWDAVRPPPFFQHGSHRNDTARNTFYWDLQAFRHAALHAAHERACMRVAGRGFRCSLHFGEFMTSNDAIYAGGAVFSLAASPWVDYVIVDSNFLDARHDPNDVRVVQLLLSAIKPFGKPVFFEGAFERIKDPATHRRAVELTVSSGAHGIGFTNWLGRVDAPTFFASVLGPAGVGPAAAQSTAAPGAAAADEGPGGASVARPLRLLVGAPAAAAPPAAGGAAPRVAVLAPHRSFLAFKGLGSDGDGKLAGDIQQEELFSCLDKIEAAVPSDSVRDLEVFAEPAMLLPRLTEFDRVWHLEPEVLLSGDARAVDAIQARARLAGVQIEACGARGAAPYVVQECCGGA